MLREQTNSNPANINQANSNPANTRTTSPKQGSQNRIKEEKSFSLLFSVFMPGIFAFFLLYLLLSPGLNLTSQAETGWIRKEDGWYYVLPSEEAHYSGWIQAGIPERWYYLLDGKMQTGWISWKGKWYFLHADGAMAEKQWIGNFYVGEDGAAFIDKESPDGWKLSGNGSYLLKGKPTEELNEKTARYIQVLKEHPDARAIFDSPGQLVLENGNAYPFIIFKKMSLYDSKTSELLYEGDAGFHKNAVLAYFDGKEMKRIHPMDLMQNYYFAAKKVFIDPAGFITYVAGEER